jgi:lipoprotein-releasing system permease protein
MNVAAFIAKRIAFNQQRSFSRFIIRIAIAATVISVAAMLVTLAFTNGFQDAVGGKVFNLWGDIRVQHFPPASGPLTEEQPIEKNDTILRMLRHTPDVTTVQAYATKNAIVRGKEGIEYILLKGVEKDYDFGNLQSFLKSGRWPRYPDSGYSSEIALSAYTANELKLKAGDRVLVYFIQNQGPPRVRPVIVSGIFKTGIEDYDKLIAIGDLKLIQRLNGWQSDEIGGYELFTTDYRKAPAIDSIIFSRLPAAWGSRTTEETYPNIFQWLDLQDNTIVLVLIIMIVVATLNLVTCLIILVLERTHMIGVLKALGSRDISIQSLFLYQGSYITLVGLALGNIIAVLIGWLQNKYGFIRLREEAYFISRAVVKFEWWHFVAVNIGTFVICFLVLMIPTIVVRRVQPVKAIQFR